MTRYREYVREGDEREREELIPPLDSDLCMRDRERYRERERDKETERETESIIKKAVNVEHA